MSWPRCKPRKRSFLHRLNASFRVENESSWSVRAATKENAATIPMPWRGCFEATWFRICTIFQAWLLWLKWLAATPFSNSAALNSATRFQMGTHWDGFKICWLNAICSSVYLHRWQFFCQHATSFSKRVSPTVLTQHPVVLNFLFSNLYLGLLCPSNITIALFPLRYPMQLETAISGGISISICIWSEHPLRFYYFHSFPLA